MARYILKRLFQSIIVLVIVTLLVFLVMHSIPGNPVQLYLGDGATREQIEHYTELFGFNEPLLVQYGKWISGIFQGEWGRSISYGSDISTLLPSRITATLSTTIPSMIISLALGVVLGIVSAVKRNSLIDSTISALSNIGMATPSFWLAICLVFIFALKLGWLPVQGYTPLTENVTKGLKELILPVVVLSLGSTAYYARQTRSAMLEVINQDYIRTARSKGLKERTTMLVHALHNAMIPLVTVLGMSIGNLLGGTVLVEQVFCVPGIGSLLLTAILNMDYFLVQDIILIMSVFALASNLIVDILYGYIDPRIRVM